MPSALGRRAAGDGIRSAGAQHRPKRAACASASSPSDARRAVLPLADPEAEARRMIAFENASAGIWRPPRAALGERRVFKPGAVTGIVGPNGAGKTTLLRAALDLLPHLGRQRAGAGPQRRRAGRARRLARTVAYHAAGRRGALAGAGRAISSPSAACRIATATRARSPTRSPRADAAHFADRRTDELSAGERARVLFARALATETPICWPTACGLARPGAPAAADGAAARRGGARNGRWR